MRGKRFAAFALSLILMISLLAVPAGAVSFTDMTGHWAKEDVEYLATQGVVKGTSNTTFSPDRKMTACEALLFCSRATGVDAGDNHSRRGRHGCLILFCLRRKFLQIREILYALVRRQIAVFI